MKSFYLLGIALASRFDCLTEGMATDSKDTDRRIGPTLLFHVSAVFYEEIPRLPFIFNWQFCQLFNRSATPTLLGKSTALCAECGEKCS
jgi:hypothetical protein